MLIVALILAVIGLAALVTAVVTNNEMIAWACIAASGVGVVLLVFDAIRERAQRRSVPAAPGAAGDVTEVIEPVAPVDVTEVIEPAVPDAAAADPELAAELAVEDHPEELVHDEPDYDMPTDDEPDFPEPAEEAAVHVVEEADVIAKADVNEAETDHGDATVVSYVPQSAETEYRYLGSSDAGSGTDSTTTDSGDIDERTDR